MDVSDLLSKTDSAQNTESHKTEAKLDDDALNLSIANVSSTVLRGLLKSLCETVPEVKAKAIETLLVAKNKIPALPDLDSEGESEGDEDEDTDTRATAPAPQPSGKRPRYSQCKRCEKEFDLSKNSPTSCVYHTEEAYADDESDLFVDNDFFGVDEANSDPSFKEEYPECFEFECCGGNLRDHPDGCKTGWHREAAPAKKKTKRYW